MKIINKYHKESFYLLMYSVFVIFAGAVLMVFTYNELHGAVLIISGTILLTCSFYPIRRLLPRNEVTGGR